MAAAMTRWASSRDLTARSSTPRRRLEIDRTDHYRREDHALHGSQPDPAFGTADGADGTLWFTYGSDPGSIGLLTFFDAPRISQPG